MGHASKLLAASLAALSAALFASPCFAAPPDGQLLMLDFKRIDETPEGFARSLTDRFRQAAEWAVPREPNGPKPLNCSIEFSADAPRFSAFTVKGRNVRIVIGGQLETLASDAATLRRLMAALLLARAGFMPESADTGYPEWLAVGLARKAATDAMMARVPGGVGFPGSQALAAGGAFPDLRAVVAGPLEPSDGACFIIYAEACQMLVVACGRAGMPQAGAFRAVVSDAAAKDGPDRLSSFLKASALCLQPKKDRDKEGRTLKRSDGEMAEFASAWFKSESRKMLWNCFTPAPAKFIESSFKEASKISYKDSSGAERNCELDELCARWDSVADARLLVAETRGRLAEVASMSPDEIQDSLGALQGALNGLLSAGSKPKSDALAPAIEAFYASLEARIALESKLKKAERSLVSPGSRFGLTMGSLVSYDYWTESADVKAAAYLDESQAKAGK